MRSRATLLLLSAFAAIRVYAADQTYTAEFPSTWQGTGYGFFSCPGTPGEGMASLQPAKRYYQTLNNFPPSGVKVTKVRVEVQLAWSSQPVPSVTVDMNGTTIGTHTLSTRSNLLCGDVFPTFVFEREFEDGLEPRTGFDNPNEIGIVGDNYFYTRSTAVTITYTPSIEVKLISGDNQRGVISNPLARPLRAQLYSPASTGTSFAGKKVVFTITQQPAGAVGAGVGQAEAPQQTTHTAIAPASGVVETVLLLGNKAGAYTVEIKSPLSATTTPLKATAEAVKPDSAVILKDALDLGHKAASYAVSATESSKFYLAGLDSSGALIGPIKSNWSVSAGGNAATRGDGSLNPSAQTTATTLTPMKVGHLLLAANPVISGVQTAKVDLFLTGLYVSIDDTFTPEDPVDQKDDFVPGQKRDGTNYPLDVMMGEGQQVRLHVLTGPGSKGTVTFTVASSSYPGVAMNYPTPPTLGDAFDLSFGGGEPSVAVPFAQNGDTVAPLRVKDYGAKGTITVMIRAGRNEYTLPALKLPIDTGGNQLPAAGWYAQGAHVSTALLQPEEDIDFSAPFNIKGDGFSNYEEYRGFVVRGAHERFDPAKKDVVINADEVLLLSWNLESILNELSQSITFHYARANEVTGTNLSPRVDRAMPIANVNRTGIPGARVNGQRALRAVHQQQKEPVYVDVNGTEYAASRMGLGGYALSVDFLDVNTINGPANPTECAVDMSNLNAFSFVEVYQRALSKQIHTDDIVTRHLDEAGNTVPDCGEVASPDTMPCDIYNPLTNIIRPRARPLTMPNWCAGDAYYVDRFSVVDALRNDYFSAELNECPPSALFHFLSPEEMEQRKTFIIGHEIGHALGMRHNSRCGNIEFEAAGLIYPMQLSFDAMNIDTIRLIPMP